MSTTKPLISIYVLAMRELGSREEPTTVVVRESSTYTCISVSLKDPKHIAACPDGASFDGEAWYFEGWATGAYRHGELRGIPYPVEVSFTEIQLEPTLTLTPASEIP